MIVTATLACEYCGHAESRDLAFEVGGDGAVVSCLDREACQRRQKEGKP